MPEHPRVTTSPESDRVWIDLMACRTFLDAADRLVRHLVAEPDAAWAFVLPIHPIDGRLTGFEAGRGDDGEIAIARWVVDPVADGGPLSDAVRRGVPVALPTATAVASHAPDLPLSLVPLRLPHLSADPEDCPRFDCPERRAGHGACGAGTLPDSWTRDTVTCGLLPVVGVIGVAGASEAARLDARAEASGQVASLFGNFRLREALSDAEYFREDILDSMTEAIVAVGLGGDVLLLNRAAEELTGTPRHEAIGAMVDDVLVEREGRVVRELTARPPRSSRGREAVLRCRDGSEVSVLVHAAPITTRGWGRRGTLVSCVDRTAVKAMESELRKLDRLATVGRFTSAVAHEIRNPLGGILAGVQYLKSNLSDDDAPSHIGFIEAEVHRLDRIVTDLQTAVTPREPNLASSSMVDVLDIVRQALVAEADDHGIAIRVVCDVTTVRMDGDLIEQVVLNLVKNAIEASEPGGVIDVHAHRHPPGGVYVDVSDGGPGVPESLRGDVFEPFVSTKRNGSGLGLYVSHSIAARHGGRIEIDSSDAGGATFRLWLPGTTLDGGDE